MRWLALSLPFIAGCQRSYARGYVAALMSDWLATCCIISFLRLGLFERLTDATSPVVLYVNPEASPAVGRVLAGYSPNLSPLGPGPYGVQTPRLRCVRSSHRPAPRPGRI